MATQAKFYTDLGFQSATDSQVDGNLTISGNLTVHGTSVTVNSTTTSIGDSMMELANANTSTDTIDIGFYGNYNDGVGSESGVSEFTGLFRDASDSTWKLFDGLEVEPSTTVNVSGTNYAYADIRVGDLTATTLTATNSLTGASISYPTSDGSNGQVLTTNGSGTLSFEDVGTTTTTVTTTATTQTNLDTWAIASFRSAHYQISISDATGTAYQSTELMLLHNGTAASISQYGTVLTGSELATFATDIDSGSLRVRITPTSTNSTVFKFKKTLIVV